MINFPFAERYRKSNLVVGTEVSKLDNDETAKVDQVLGYNLEQDRVYFALDNETVGFTKLMSDDDE